MTAEPFPGLKPGLRGERRAVVTPEIATTHAGGRGFLRAADMFLEMELAATPKAMLAGVLVDAYTALDAKDALPTDQADRVRRLTGPY